MIKLYYLMPHPPIMIPEVGQDECGKIEKTITACKLIGKEIRESDIDTIVIITPHGILFRDAVGIVSQDEISGDLRKFGAPNVKRKYEIDRELTEAIIKSAGEKDIPFIELNKEAEKQYNIKVDLDHGALVPLYNITKDIKLVHINYGLLTSIELYKAGMAIAEATKSLGRKVALIASGDLSHRLKNSSSYDFSKYGEEFDKAILGKLQVGNIKDIFTLNKTMIEEAGECGLRSIYMLIGAMDGLDVKGELLSYEGTFGVGYGVMKFNTKPGKSIINDINKTLDEEYKRKISEGNEYTKLARSNLERYFNEGKLIDDIPKSLTKEQAGVFVSLKKSGELRGCIGTIYPITKSVGEEIVRNSISAALNDPRFNPVEKVELKSIDISVDILGKPEICTKEDLDPKNYGVIVTYKGKKGLLLPNLQGINSVEEQLSIALQKGGISENEPYEIEKFKVERFIEGE